MKDKKPLLLLFGLLLVFSVVSTIWFSNRLDDWNLEDVNAKTNILARSLENHLREVTYKNDEKLFALLEHLTEPNDVIGIALCNGTELVTKSQFFPTSILCHGPIESHNHEALILRRVKIIPEKSLNLNSILIAYDKANIEKTSSHTKTELFFFLLFILALTAFSTWVLVHLTRQTAVEFMTSLIRNRGTATYVKDKFNKDFIPVMKEVRTLVRELESDKKLREGSNLIWDSQSLKEVLVSKLAGDQVLVVANREPYIHNFVDNEIKVQVPASGLVTALEPVMRACSGIWFAHGSGSADKATVDESDKVWVPPENPQYQIKRLWLTKEEEEGFYYGFSNEGLWPLCHIAHIRPIFRLQNFKMYEQVNRKFAEAIEEEAHREDPIILVQDYHFALLPRMIREKLPKATIITFWHIPWPNPEKFGIVPWVEELLDGMLGSSVLGFHTKYHCYNFLETVDRYLECRINWERSTISYKGEVTAVRQYPISIEFPPKALGEVADIETCRQNVLKRHKLPADTMIGIGVERLDYTKGIIERFMAIERFFELHPEWIGKFSFIQIAAPSRAGITTYKQFADEVKEMVERVNHRFSNPKAPPIVLIHEHRTAAEVMEYFRSAKLCVVMSLHDGMNLVAKEFIASREDERGSLILSLFAGAAKEFPQAFLVNPYDIEQIAESIFITLKLDINEEIQRMRSMRNHVREHNVYRWAGNMLMDAVNMRERNRLLERVSEYTHRPGYWQ